jgi:HEAT repeat protein
VLAPLDTGAHFCDACFMAKARGLEAKLGRVRALRDEALTAATVAELRRLLGDDSDLVVAGAAEVVAARQIVDLGPDLVTAFDRFLELQDRSCRAKLALVRALNQLEYPHEDVFRRASRVVQEEYVHPGSKDVAGLLRGEAALGLVRLRCRDIMILLADLLADPDTDARRGAAQALGGTGMIAAIPLLRFKVRVGDQDAAVTGDCLTSLMALAPAESLSFVAEFLRARDEAVQEGAAFALAESRSPEALPILIDYWPRARRSSLEEVVLLAISMLRLPAALDFLVHVVSNEEQSSALTALSALRIHRHNDALKQRVAAAVAQRGDAVLTARFEKKFNATD